MRQELRKNSPTLGQTGDSPHRRKSDRSNERVSIGGNPLFMKRPPAESVKDLTPTTRKSKASSAESQAPPAKPEAWSLDISVRSDAALIQTDQAF